MATHAFGGDWTTEKLERVRKYLCAYTTIFKQNPRATYFTTIYVDAFVGTGERVPSVHRRDKTMANVLVENDADVQALLKGSARIALEVDPAFDRFLFIEQNVGRAKELEKLRNEFPNRTAAIDIEQGDANEVLREWCEQTDWRRHRAVVFLDPYGMQLDWATIAAIAKTEAIDLWVLFPLGMAVNRLLTKHEPPPKKWAEALTRFFGNEDWRHEFYPKKVERTLFGDEETQRKEASFERIGRFFLKRLDTVFAKVASNPLILNNSKGVPIFLLCFAAGNPRGPQLRSKLRRIS